MRTVLKATFFNRSTLEVAQDLLGKFLVRRFPDGTEIALRITEVEAYDGPEDLACHASKGRSPRTEVMFGEAGHFYVYFCYGVHWLLNIVTGPKDYPAAVLIRGLEGLSGPARLTKALQIDGSFNGKKVCPGTALWVEDKAERITSIKRTARIGVHYAGPIWSQKEYRFSLT